MTQFKLAALGALLISTMALGACQNTVHGAGKDIERAGEAVQN